MNIPTSTQWITFPKVPKDAVWVKWSEDNIKQQALYYVMQCYYGDLKETNNNTNVAQSERGVTVPRVCSPSQKMDIKGSTKLFIASEYIEPEYYGGPLESFHILNIAKAAATSDNIKTDASSVWIKMQLNDCFQYGENSTNLKRERWIVYHPRICTGLEFPDIWQHRFTEVKSLDSIKSFLGHAPSAVSEIGEVAVQAAGAFIEVARNIKGESLHTFLDATAIQKVEGNRKKITDILTRVNPASKDDGYFNNLLLLQWLEGENAKEDNKKSDKDIKGRLRKLVQSHFDMLTNEVALREILNRVEDVVADKVAPGSNEEETQQQVGRVDGAIDAYAAKFTAENGGALNTSRGATSDAQNSMERSVTKYLEEVQAMKLAEQSGKIPQQGILRNENLDDTSQKTTATIHQSFLENSGKEHTSRARSGLFKPISGDSLIKNNAPGNVNGFNRRPGHIWDDPSASTSVPIGSRGQDITNRRRSSLNPLISNNLSESGGQREFSTQRKPREFSPIKGNGVSKDGYAVGEEELTLTKGGSWYRIPPMPRKR